MPLPRWHDLAAQAAFPANRRLGQRVKLAPTGKRALGIPTDARIHSHPSDLAGTSSPRPLPATDAPLGNPSVVRLDELMATDFISRWDKSRMSLPSTTGSSGQHRTHGESSPPFGLSLFVLGSWSRQCRVELFHRGVFRDTRQPLEIPINLRWSGLTLVDCDSHQNDTGVSQSGSSIGPISAKTSPGPGLSGWVRPPKCRWIPQTAFNAVCTAPSTHAGVHEMSSPARKMPR
jgi:hypothetical protein